MGFFSKCYVGKKSHVDMRFSHVNMGFFSQHGILKKSHVNMEHLFLMTYHKRLFRGPNVQLHMVYCLLRWMLGEPENRF
jgi:hypothetical protein